VGRLARSLLGRETRSDGASSGVWTRVSCVWRGHRPFRKGEVVVEPHTSHLKMSFQSFLSLVFLECLTALCRVLHHRSSLNGRIKADGGSAFLSWQTDRAPGRPRGTGRSACLQINIAEIQDSVCRRQKKEKKGTRARGQDDRVADAMMDNACSYVFRFSPPLSFAVTNFHRC
jgi:hypothetical protein